MKRKLLYLFCAVLLTAMSINAQVLYESDFAQGASGWVPNKGDWKVQDNPVIPDQPNQYGIIEGAGINGDGGTSLSEENKPIFTLYDAASFANYKVTAVLYPIWGNLFGLVFNYTDNDNYWVLEIAARDKDAWIKQVKNGDFVGTYKWMPRDGDELIYAKYYADTVKNALWIENDVDPLNNYWTIELTCNEYAETTIKVNGETVFENIDAGEEGKIGIWQNWCPVFAKSVKVEDLGTEAYVSDFAQGASGWVPNKGDWKVQDNPVIPDQPNQYGIIEGAGINGDGGTSLSEENKPIFTLYDAASFANYKVTAVLYPIWGNLFGLVFNYTDNDNYWVLEIAARDKDAWIKQVKNGDFVGTYKWMPRDGDELIYAKYYADTVKNALWIENDVDPLNNYWTIELTCNEYAETTIKVNGETVFENIDAGEEGKIGIWQNWCPVFAKSVKVNTFGSPTGVNEILNINSFSVYPNPISLGKNLVISSKNFNSISQLEIFDITGKMVFKQQTENTNQVIIDTNQFKGRGFYFIRINGIKTHKLIVN